MVENNILYSYAEFGEHFSYEDKIKCNEDAEAFHKPEEIFHGNKIILA
jgi:hypothetical protein